MDKKPKKLEKTSINSNITKEKLSIKKEKIQFLTALEIHIELVVIILFRH